MGWGLRGKAQRAIERTLDAVVPENAPFIAFQGMRRHKRVFGTYPSLIRPKTFSEKVLHRMVFDRRPILTELQDKYAVRDYVRQRIGDHILPKLYWVTENPSDIPFDDLPDKFVAKATHGCGWVYLVPDKARLNRQDLVDKCTEWLSWNYYYRPAREWAYKNIEPRILVEEFIDDDSGLAPVDYKFYVFGGKVHLVWVITGRFVDIRNDGYTPSWDRLEIKAEYKSIGRPIPRPPHLDEMIKHAEILADDLDFLRVDLYDAGKVYFGEITLYPGGGCTKFYEPRWNRHFGGLWDLSIRRKQVHGVSRTQSATRKGLNLRTKPKQ